MMASPDVLGHAAVEATERKSIGTRAKDILSRVGFEKGKIGAGAKELGYQIKQTSLKKLLGILFLSFLCMGILVSWMGYGIKVEKKNNLRKVRHMEHSATNKLARVDLELLSQYHDDVRESHEADMLLRQYESAYDHFKPRFEGMLKEIAVELKLEQQKSKKFTDQILHLVAAMQDENMKHSKNFVNRIKQAGKHAAKLEENVEKELQHDVKEEAAKEDDDDDYYEEDDYDGKDSSDTELKGSLQEIFSNFHEHERQFGPKFRAQLETKGPLYRRIQKLYTRMVNGTVPSEEVSEEVAAWNLKSLGANFTHAKIELPPDDIVDMVEALVLSPNIPYSNITMLENNWRSGKENSVHALTQLTEWREEDQVPTGWFEDDYDEDDYDDSKNSVVDR